MRKLRGMLTFLFVFALLFTAVPVYGEPSEANSPSALLPLASPAIDATDWDLPTGGHFYTQTGGGQNRGYSITDEGGIPFWTEYQRLGGTLSLGYPVSRRFDLNGYICQAMQRVIFQWRPETNTISFVNVFDILHDKNGDQWLELNKQVPKPLGAEFTAGLDWNGTVQKRLALLDAFPAIKAQYNSVANPIEMNGLPTSAVTDMGDSYTVRCQRIVIQQWKKDVPWAKAGQVTVANGGDIAKDAELIPAIKMLSQLPPIQTCGSEGEYVAYAKAVIAQTDTIDLKYRAGAIKLANMIWNTPDSDPNKANFEKMTPYVLESMLNFEKATLALREEFTAQRCVPARYTQSHQQASEAMQKAVEGASMERQGFQSRNLTLCNQGAAKIREANNLLEASGLR
jgi:hypothetical protein